VGGEGKGGERTGGKEKHLARTRAQTVTQKDCLLCQKKVRPRYCGLRGGSSGKLERPIIQGKPSLSEGMQKSEKRGDYSGPIICLGH